MSSSVVVGNQSAILRLGRVAVNVSRGFNAGLIEAVGRGEREPAVPTADDVDEPRNRRVEILVR
jgi:flagellar motor protein MotB